MKKQHFLRILLAAGLGLVGIVLLFLSGDKKGEGVDLAPRGEGNGAASPGAGLDEPLLPGPKRNRVFADRHVPPENSESGEEPRRQRETEKPESPARTGPTGRVSGRVTDAALRPVAGAAVFITEYSGPESASFLEEMRWHGPPCPVGEARAGDAGVFRLDGVPVGTIRVWAGTEGMFHSLTEPFEVRENEEVAGVDLVLEPFAPEDTITGVVVTPEGEGVEGARISAYFRTERMDGITTLRSGAGGHFVCVVEDKADHDFTVTDPEGRYSPMSFLGVAPGARDVVLRLAPLRILRLRVRTGDGEAVPFYEAWVSSPGPRNEISGDAFSSSCFDEDGAVSIAVPDDRLYVRVLVHDCRIASIGPLVPDGMPGLLDVTVESLPAVCGRVVDLTGLPIAGARVSLEEAFAPGDSRDRENVITHRPRSRSCTTGGDGSFAIHFERAGRFSLFVRTAGYTPSRTQPRLFDGLIGESGIEITLSPIEK
jgi:hypothetical protein